MPSLSKSLSSSIRNATNLEGVTVMVDGVAGVFHDQQRLVERSNGWCLENSTAVDLLTLKGPGIDVIVFCVRLDATFDWWLLVSSKL